MTALFRVRLIFGVLLLLQLIVAINADAQTPFTGLPSQAMGGTGRAAIDAPSVAFLNPASMAHVRGYNIAVADRFASNAGDGGSHDFMLHASESQTDSLFPLAITYLKSTYDSSVNYFERKELHFTLAQIEFKNFAVGVDFARYTFTPFHEEAVVHWAGTLGLLYTPKENMGLGLTFSNWWRTGNFYFNKRNVQFGLNYLFDTFLRADFDIVYQTEDNPKHQGVVMAGLEHTLLQNFPLRAGFRSDAFLNTNYWTAGLGWTGPKLGLDYAYEKNVSNSVDYSHSVDLRIYF